jgi:hypothetical protein
MRLTFGSSHDRPPGQGWMSAESLADLVGVVLGVALGLTLLAALVAATVR